MTGFMFLILLLSAQVGAENPAVSASCLTASSPQSSASFGGTGRFIQADGWSTPKLLSTYANWDYWWLNTRIGIDDTNTVHALVSMYNYSVSNSNFYRDVLDVSGNHLSHESDWNGFKKMPIVTDTLGRNHYIGQPVIGMLGNQDAGAVDPANNIYTSTSDTYGDVYYTKMDGLGNYIYYNLPAAVGAAADAWPGETQLGLDSQDDIYIAWSRNTHEVVYIKSTNDGLTWSTPVTIASDFTYQVNKPKMLIDADDHMHFIWQHWNGAFNELVYKQLYPDGTTCVDETTLNPAGIVDVWDPTFAMDSLKRIHIFWSIHYEGSQSLYHTMIDGTLDKGGSPATDAEITLIQEYPFHTSTTKKRYPKAAVDSFDNVHLIFDQGQYGCGTTKMVYYMKYSAKLAVDAYELSESAGGVVNFMLTAGEVNANRNYLLLGSTSGTEPGILLPGGSTTLPVNWDWFSSFELALLNTVFFNNFLGTLDAKGMANAQLYLPPLPSGSAGLAMYYAYCCDKPFDFASNPVVIEVVK